jgi:hypothetical protein
MTDRRTPEPEVVALQSRIEAVGDDTDWKEVYETDAMSA